MKRLRERVVPSGQAGSKPSSSLLSAANARTLSPRSHNSVLVSNRSKSDGSGGSGDGPSVPTLTTCNSGDSNDDGYEMSLLQQQHPWRRSTSIPSAPSSSTNLSLSSMNMAIPLTNASGATLSTTPTMSSGSVSSSGGFVFSLWHVGMIRDLRVRWYLLTPTMRRTCLFGLLPIFVFMTLTGTIDALFSSYGRHNKWMDVTSAFGVHGTDFAVVINTYKRPRQLADAVRHYADTCGHAAGVQHVYIIWAEEGVTPPTTDSFFAHYMRQQSLNRAPVSIVSVQNSLNSRFLPIPGVTDMAVFMVDDDIRVGCPSLRQGFDAWKTHPYSMVGYYPRLAAQSSREDGSTATSTPSFVYQSWPIVFWRNRMNFILTKACFLHSHYMSLYSDSSIHPKEVLSYVDTYFNCEDVAMSLLVANITRSEPALLSSRPIYVEGTVSDKGLFNGISTGTGHMTRRSDCLTDLTAIYQRNGWDVPLDTAYSLRDSSWLSHAPGFWWQSRPSNLFEWFALENIFK